MRGDNLFEYHFLGRPACPQHYFGKGIPYIQGDAQVDVVTSTILSFMDKLYNQPKCVRPLLRVTLYSGQPDHRPSIETAYICHLISRAQRTVSNPGKVVDRTIVTSHHPTHHPKSPVSHIHPPLFEIRSLGLAPLDRLILAE